MRLRVTLGVLCGSAGCAWARGCRFVGGAVETVVDEIDDYGVDADVEREPGEGELGGCVWPVGYVQWDAQEEDCHLNEGKT